ncbi:hypothetical protein ASD15_21985 [Massilia sp. Root351]|jgi:hypothetical protein|uniref:hypothetical protein n=1 Tax=Massilia sp. Root351 TaxID=1736522 RepID=UPI000709D384|nr:hypothetical protein [Massilia sp. Root351]KQV78485.1 hypothetical protein ASD15_21985 [Massilia sp. Root351]
MRYNKLQLAGELLVAAAEDCRNAACDQDYAKSILVAGAVTGIVEPLLKELGIVPHHIGLARGAVEFKELDGPLFSPEERAQLIRQGRTYYQLAYSALKHAGFPGKNIKASENLEFETNLKEEAYYLVDSAINDYIKIPAQYLPSAPSEALQILLAKPWELPFCEDDALHREQKA